MIEPIIDFTNCKESKKAFNGGNGNKKSIIYNGIKYMLKFPSESKGNLNISYTNGCFSEYLGSHIFSLIGFNSQKTVLGQYKINNKDKIVVACEDFAIDGYVLQDFGSIKNQVITSSGSGYGTNLEDVLDAISKQNVIDSNFLLQYYWDMFIVDALLGNWDRHNGNWGFLYNQETDDIKLAPIFDCGSSLYPQADESIMNKCLTDEKELNFRIYQIPTSPLRINNQKINYFDFISSLSNKDCNEALNRILPKINLNDIYSLIDDTPLLTNLQRTFYKTMLKERKERILDYSFNKLVKR